MVGPGSLVAGKMKLNGDIGERTQRRPKSSHPIDVANVSLPPELARSRYGRWRALSLAAVYALMMIHILHWKVAGKTMAPLELSEIMKALELRVLSAGVIFIGLMIVGSAIFGRFFCSWGCHMLAAQDLSHWILKRLRIRPRPVRSRVLLFVPVLAATYMFVWPQIRRMWEGRSLPEASARLVTSDFWRDLPGPLIITLTFLTCGLLIVYLFGGRGFCTYGCPYGVLFGLMDRISPGKIRAGGHCEQCGRCTAICTSNVRVHEEIKAYGMVVNPRCMKDLDCVSVCPQNNLRYAFGRPSLARSRQNKAPAPRYDFSIAEDLAMLAIFVLALLIWRGLYDRLPFLMSVALSAVTAYVVITFGRLFYRRELSLNRYLLKQRGKLLRASHAFAAVSSLFLLFTLHSAFVQYHRWRGKHYFAAAHAVQASDPAAQAQRRTAAERSIAHLALCDRYGLVSTTSLEMELGTLMLQLDRTPEAETYFRRAVDRNPNYPEARIQLASTLADRGKVRDAAGHLAYALKIHSPHEEYQPRLRQLTAAAHVKLGALLAQQERFQPAEKHFRDALELNPDSAEVYLGLGKIAGDQGRLDEAVSHYRTAIRLDARAAEPHANLGDVLVALNDPESAIAEYRSALAINPQIEQVHFKLGVVYYHTARLAEALQHFAAAVKQSPGDLEARTHYAVALRQAGRSDEASRLLQKPTPP